MICLFRHLPLCALLAVTACANPPQMDLSTQAAGGQLAYGAPTLAAAKQAFFGTDAPNGNSGSGGGSDLISPTDPVTLRGMPPTVTQLTLSRRDDLGGMVLRSAAVLGYQHLRGTLPHGIGVLTDPLQLQMWSQSLGLQMTLGQSRALPMGLQLDYAAGLGVAQVNAATRLQSALLDVRGRSQQTLPYAMAEARLTGSTGPSVLADLMVFGSGATELRLGLAQEF